MTAKFQAISLVLRYVAMVPIFVLIGCGGGDGGDKVRQTGNNIYTLQKPNYTGATNLFEIPQQEASEIILDVTLFIDLIQTIIYGDSKWQFFLLPIENSGTTSEDIFCSSGNVETAEIVKGEHLQVTYSDCLIEGVTFDGSVDVHVIELSADGYILEKDVIVDLTILEGTNQELLSINGYVKTRKQGVENKLTSSAQILIASAEQQFYFDDFVISEEENFNFTSFDGDIYFSEFGLIRINTSSLADRHQTISFQSNNQFDVNISLQKSIYYQYDDNFVPVYIDLDNIPNSFFDEINDQPVAMIHAAKASGERDTEFLLSTQGSYDPDLEPIIYRWSLLSKPDDSLAYLEGNNSASLFADLPGNYTLQLEVSDSVGNSDVITQDFYVKQGSPILRINTMQEYAFVDDPVDFTVTPMNDIYDGPIHFRLSYGPPGMHISPGGLVTWEANVPDFSRDLTVNFAVDAYNRDKTSTIEQAVTVKSLHPNQYHTLLPPIPGFRDWGDNNFAFKIDSTKEAVISGDRAFQLSLDENNHIQVSSPFRAIPVHFEYRASAKLTDGLYHFFVSDNPDYIGQTPYQLWRLSEATQALELIGSANFDNWAKIDFKDVNSDGAIELVGYRDKAFQTDPIVYSTFDFKKLYEVTNAPEYGVTLCDFDGDGMDEFIARHEIYSFDKGETIASTELTIAVSVLINGSESCHVLAHGYDGILVLLSWENGQVKYTPLTEEIKLHRDRLSVNLDNQSDTEILFYDFNKHIWISFSVNIDGSVDKTIVKAPVNINTDQVISAFDIDGDGFDEILLYKFTTESYDNTGTENLISAYSIEGDQMSIEYTMKSSFLDMTMNNHISDFNGSEVSIYRNYDFNDARIGEFSKGREKLTRTLAAPIYGASHGKIIGSHVTNGQHFYYVESGTNAEKSINKYTNTGALIWRTQPIDHYSSRNLMDFQVKMGNMVALSRLGMLLIDDKSGNIIHVINEYHLHLTKVTPSVFDALLITSFHPPGVHTIENQEFTMLWDASDNNWGLESDDLGQIEFIQYDNDEQLELVIYPRVNAGAFVILDSLTWNYETLPPFLDATTSNFPSDFFDSKSSCLPNDTQCRHKFIVGSDPRLVDKLTGKTIWKVPIKLYSEPRFYVHPNGHISTAIGGVGLYIFD
ncbi:hypothetical protein [Thalassotalea sp. PS06]|uniref:hypothetical protein n=1 Tax=Thalassotalea sp. PS06 TaxID=2594005 RepID=UPI0011658159|nr:hypothetical protein [Thalassotalea sp. PS06]QDP01493.1 hypothetical protein FNC98_09200 [Thalassotalea sp. PS06]